VPRRAEYESPWHFRVPQGLNELVPMIAISYVMAANQVQIDCYSDLP